MGRFLAVLSLLALLVGVAGCGSSGSSKSGGRDHITVGVIPIVDVAPIYLGEQQGFFAKRGIDLKLQQESGGAAAVPGVGSLHRFRDAVENDWPRPLELEEHSHAGLANRYVAAASGLPFAVLRGYRGTDLPAHTQGVAQIECPFTGETLTAVAALELDVAVVHAQRADRAGNVQLWGLVGVQKEAVLAARRSLATVEEVVDELDPRPDAVVLPHWAVTRVAVVPGGARPSYAHGYYDRDNAYYRAWDEISRDRDRFQAWVEELEGVRV